MKPSSILVYHNPSCSKSRQAVEVFKQEEVDIEIYKYMKEGMKSEDLEQIVELCRGEPNLLIRNKSERKLHTTRAQVLKYLSENPKDIERPIIIHLNENLEKTLVYIARPTEVIQELSL